MLFQANFLKNFSKSKYIALLPDFREEKTQKISTAIATISLVFLFVVFAMLPTISSIGQLQQEKGTDETINNQLQQKIDNLSTLQQKYNSLQNDLPYILASVPRKTDMPLLEAQLQSLAKVSNLDITSLQATQISNDQTTSSQGYQSFNISFSAEGNYQDLLSFLSNVITMQRIITPNNISMSKKIDNSSKLQFQLGADTYFKP
jgi:Tfp pilus assembly protein PilO